MRLNGWSRSVMAEKICFYFGDQSVSQCIEIVERKKVQLINVNRKMKNIFS